MSARRMEKNCSKCKGAYKEINEQMYCSINSKAIRISTYKMQSFLSKAYGIFIQPYRMDRAQWEWIPTQSQRRIALAIR